MAAALTQRPDLARAVHCAVPLTDMVRFPEFLIARLWIPEYGDPADPEAFAWLHAYSPYHHVVEGTCYPAVLFTTAEGDTRVDPNHARKMAAQLQWAPSCQDERPILFRQEGRAGHGVGKPLHKQADEAADVLAFLAWQLGVAPVASPVTTIAELLVADDPRPGGRSGSPSTTTAGARSARSGCGFSPAPGGGRAAVIAWTLAGVPDEDVTDVDGLPTTVGEPPPPASARPPPDRRHAIDHVVVMTPDLDRTVRAVERSLGLPLKRTRDGEAYGRAVRQAFFRMGEVILEVVGPPEPDPVGGGPTGFFGLAWSTWPRSTPPAELLGPDLVSAPKPAVQPGRSIATVRSARRACRCRWR